MRKKIHDITRAMAPALLLSVFLQACAIQGGAPVGGDKDVTPPKVLKQSPPSLSKNFHGDKIELCFDEYFTLDNPQREIIITPSPKGDPQYNVKKKTLEIDLRKTKLDSNTTYTISFGNAIKDYNEGNVLRDFQYVFSTGNYLDSLKMEGAAEDALTQKPVEKSIAILFHPGNDSDIYKSRPLYYTPVDASGKFTFKNLPKASFRLYILNDANGNYLLDEGEEVGFYPGVITLDSNFHLSSPIEMFRQNKPPVLSATAVVKDRVQLKFAQPVDSVSARFTAAPDARLFYKKSKSGDSLSIWPSKVVTGGKLELTAFNGTQKMDSALGVSDHISVKGKVGLNYYSAPEAVNSYGTPLVVESNVPIQSIDLSKYQFSVDNMPLHFNAVRFLDSSHTLVGFYFDYQPDSVYLAKFLPGAFQSFFGTVNDTGSTLASLPSKKNFAYLEVNVNLASGGQYLFQLVNEKGDVIFEQILTSSGKVAIPYANAGAYRMRVILDANRNGKFDPGNLLQGRQAEQVVYYPDVLNLKANWELMDIQFKVPQMKGR